MFFKPKQKRITRKKLYEVSEAFVSDTSFFIRVGAELEFYCKHSLDDSAFFAIIAQHCADYGIIGIESEKGRHQYEIQFEPSYYPVKLADNILAVKTTLTQLFEQEKYPFSFEAKPLPNQPGNGMHIHISLHDKDGGNLFAKENDADAELTLFSINGLLEMLPASMRYFAPHTKDYARYTGDKETANSISWGSNNRSTALRLPETTVTPMLRRIEHRIPCASANPIDVLYVIVKAVQYGLEKKQKPTIEKTHGDAFLDKYQLNKLPASLKEARKINSDYL
jgi:glutamine synthetase